MLLPPQAQTYVFLKFVCRSLENVHAGLQSRGQMHSYFMKHKLLTLVECGVLKLTSPPKIHISQFFLCEVLTHSPC